MHILLISDRPDLFTGRPPSAPDGVAVYLHEVAGRLRRIGHKVSHLALGDRLVPRDMAEHDTYSRPSVSVRRRTDLDQDILKLVRRLGPDIIHLHGTYFVLGPWIIPELRRIAPLVCTLHDISAFCPKQTLLRSDRSICTRRLGPGCAFTGCFKPEGVKDLVLLGMGRRKMAGIAACDRVIAPSRFIRDIAVRNGLDRRFIDIVPNFSRFEARGTAPPGEARLLFVGRLTREKGADVLIASLPYLQTKGWQLDIVGEGPLRAMMETEIAEGGYAARVRFRNLVPVSEMPALYSEADLVVLPYMMPESFAMAGLEALTAGRPVTGFAVGGMTDWMVEEAGCFPVPRGDFKALAAMIDACLATPTRPPPVDPRYSLQAHIESLERVYLLAAARERCRA